MGRQIGKPARVVGLAVAAMVAGQAARSPALLPCEQVGEAEREASVCVHVLRERRRHAKPPARQHCCHASRRRGFAMCSSLGRVHGLSACACACVLPRQRQRVSRGACLRVQVQHDYVHPVLVALPAAFALNRHVRCISMNSLMTSKHADRSAQCELLLFLVVAFGPR